MKKLFIFAIVGSIFTIQASDKQYKITPANLATDVFELNDRLHAHIYHNFAPTLPSVAPDKPLDLINFALPHAQNLALIHVKPLDAMALGAIGVQRVRGVESAYREYKQTHQIKTAAQQHSKNLTAQINKTSCAHEKKSLALQLIEQNQIVHDAKAKLTPKAIVNNALTKNPSKLAKAVILAANADTVKDFGEMVTYGKKKFDEMEYKKVHQTEDFCTIQ
jgi:hypothetical protein